MFELWVTYIDVVYTGLTVKFGPRLRKLRSLVTATEQDSSQIVMSKVVGLGGSRARDAVALVRQYGEAATCGFPCAPAFTSGATD